MKQTTKKPAAKAKTTKKAALAVIKIPAGQANYMLFKLGEDSSR